MRYKQFWTGQVIPSEATLDGAGNLRFEKYQETKQHIIQKPHKRESRKSLKRYISESQEICSRFKNYQVT
jgi:hypothetical protein